MICGQKILRPIGRKAGYGFEFPSPLIEFPHRSSGVSVAMLCSLRLTFERRGFHDSLTHTSIVLFCVDARAVCERWCRWGSFESPSFPFSGTGRRNSIVFRSFLRIPTSVVSRCAPGCHRKGVSIIRCGVSRGVAARSCLMAGGEIKKFLFACFPTAGAAAFCYLSERIKAGAGVSK